MRNLKQVLAKTTAVLMIAVLLIGVVPIGSLADVDWSEFAFEVSAFTESGQCGDNVYYTLSTYTLTISGTGDMWNYSVNDGTYSPFKYVSSINDIIIEPGVTSIGNEIFRQSTVENIQIPDSVTKIGKYAFFDCDYLTSICIPESVTDIGEAAFYDCDGLTSIDIPKNIKTINESTFMFCDNLQNITMPNGVTSIGEEAFRECNSLVSITIPDSVTSIGECAFIWCENLSSVFLGNGLTHIGNSAFQDCEKITEINIPDSVREIGGGAFSNCDGLENIKIPYGITTIEGSTFHHTENLKSITIPSSVKVIGSFAFWDCYDLEDVYFGGSEEEWNSIQFGENNDYIEYGVTMHYAIGHQVRIDSSYGVEARYEKGVFDEDIDIFVSKNDDNASHVLGDICSKFDVYNISFELNGETVQPNGKVTVKLPVPEDYDINSLAVYYIDDNDTLTKLNSKYENGYIIFETNHFSEYAVVEEIASPNHIHSYTAKTTTSATCTKTGIKTYTCSCGDSYTEIIKATGKHTGGTATCKAKAKCSVCGTEYGSLANHKETTLAAKSATYTSTGLTAGKKCSVCGKITVAQKTIAKLTLGKVSGLKAKKVKVAKSSEITLAWNKVTGAKSYEVYQKSGSKWKKIKTTSSTSYTVKNLKADKEYQFKVRAVVDGANGAYSSILTVETIPETASKLTLKAGKKQLTASWSKVSDISGYEVQYSTSKKFTKKTTKTVKVKKSSKKTTINKLKKGKKYYVRVRTYKTVNGKKIYSDWSRVKNVKVK